MKLDDQFGTLSQVAIKPMRLCAPTDKNGEGVRDAASHLMCYRLRRAPGAAPFPGVAQVFTSNQFGVDQFAVFGPRELCVPSSASTGFPTTSSSTSTTSTSTTTTSFIFHEQLCCEVTLGSPGAAVCLQGDGLSSEIDVTCNLLGTVGTAALCDPVARRCVPQPPVPASDYCCQCPVASPPFPEPQLCFEGATGTEADCQTPCVLFPGVECGGVSQACGGSPSGAFLDEPYAVYG